MMQRKKILFVAEAVTLAHVGRPLALSASLDRTEYEVHFACADRYGFCFEGADLVRWTIHSIPNQQFLQALADGKPVYDAATLAGYVEEDLQLLRQVRPDVVVGDFRLSLSISARLAGVPYVSLINAYWSPFVEQEYIVPSLPLTRFLPIPLANALFKLARPLAFALHTIPLNKVRRRHGLPSLGWDLNRVYTDADYTLYADVPELFPPHDLPANHAFIGPVLWSPPLPLPNWWDQLPAGRPLVYVTVGSSGHGALLPGVLRALAGLPLTVLAATVGMVKLDAVPDNARVADFLPGEEAARRAALVICNGGSPTSHQALAAGVPLVGIAGNLDQFLNMQGIVAAGAGALLRADRFDEAALRQAVEGLLATPAASAAARQLMVIFGNYRSSESFSKLLSKILTTT
ncbi:glycosyltransferase [Duganella sp. Root198D2]|uniref:glycosyltransferase n=1 Tax=Duganella sp. Root198D2 TaxID=1736489 RepID=UPI000B206A39|nr:glycosyltransferase [Duganella sp. Root198D2]